MTSFRKFLVATFTTLLVLTATSCTHTRPTTLYSSTTAGGALERIPVEGGVPQLVYKVPPRALEYDPSRKELLLGDRGISALPLGSSSTRLLVRSSSAKALAIDSKRDHVYWVDWERGSGDRIRCLDLSSGSSWLVFDAEGHAIRDIAVDERREVLYWSLGSSVSSHKQPGLWRSDLDGAGAEVLIGGIGPPRNIAVDRWSGRLFWAAGSGNSPREIWVARRDGSRPRMLVSGLLHHVEDLVFDPASRKLYWAEREKESAPDRLSRIRRCNADGSNVETIREVRSGNIYFRAIALGDAPAGGK